MFTITFPIDIGTFVIVDMENVDLTNSQSLRGHVGTIACYQCVDNDNDEHIVMVSGYKDSWCGEYLLSEIRIATDEEIHLYEQEMRIQKEDDNQ